jgi:cGMP-dependent protein kinase
MAKATKIKILDLNLSTRIDRRININPLPKPDYYLKEKHKYAFIRPRVSTRRSVVKDQTKSFTKLHNAEGVETDTLVCKELTEEDKFLKSLNAWNNQPLPGLVDLEAVQMLGEGGFGQVFLMQTKDKSLTFALKTIRKCASNVAPTKLKNAVVIGEEDLMHLANNCPFIIKLITSYHNKTHNFLAMEACLGGNLEERLFEKQMFTNSECRFYVACLIEALEYLHDTLSIVHRDIKPANLVIDSRGYAKLCDFGLAVQLPRGTMIQQRVGSEIWMAPEVRFSAAYDRAADLWSTGIVIYKFLTGFLPFSLSTDEREHPIYKPSRRLSSSAEDLFKQLCNTQQPHQRLGYRRVGDIKKHPWFTDEDNPFAWSNLIGGNLEPPYIPSIYLPRWKVDLPGAEVVQED